MTERIVQIGKNLMSIPKLSPKAEQERRASVFGMIESGKTTTLLELQTVCTDYANKANKPRSKEKFHFLVVERTSGIRQALGEFYQGMFPEKTPMNRVFEADFLMRFDKMIGKQQLRLPFCETAGETMSQLLDRFQKGQYEISPFMQDANLIHDYILDTDAIVLIAPVTRGVGIEAEKGAAIQLPDVNLSRLLTGIYEYKTIDNTRPILGIAVFLTKYDALRKFLETKQMDLNTQEGVHKFMSRHFPQTYNVLGWYGLDNVKFWATGVEIETEKNEVTGEVQGKLHPMDPQRGYKIKIDHVRGVPIFTEQPFYEFIDWLKGTVMA